MSNALALLNNYGGDSSDEEVPGPKVSTKRTFKEDEDCNYSKKRLPVPQQFLQSKSLEHQDDPSLHAGRVRSFAHERGNWATFVHIPYEAQCGVVELFSHIEETVPKHLELKIADDFHISLTKTVILKYHWISAFVKSLQENLKHFRKFFILFDSVKVYCNEERTRTFLGIQIRSGRDTLVKMVETLDICLKEYDLPTFYKDPSFHMSIAWCVGDVEKELQNYLPQINDKLEQLMEIHSQDNWYIYVDYLLCKTGNKYFQFVLS
ncbi:unnamed protein product [Ceutorhynchus assimilis]|uniref:U6 snRNA phosphodiesterase n=1 Tax=Ceutorhynchus assimilis TaxID=467358 RepID=A0A9N9QHP8_9CUCU|nr:unnamed protein product [Ceutorhynchus assimilis]